MREIVAFFKSIFLLNDNNDIKVGLSQFKTETPVEKKKLVLKASKDIKISDLMRRSA
ncbi:hypothetical protein IJZ97_05525 [bacterium]|nr:hypothetical protein [bacterium]